MPFDFEDRDLPPIPVTPSRKPLVPGDGIPIEDFLYRPEEQQTWE